MHPTIPACVSLVIEGHLSPLRYVATALCGMTSNHELLAKKVLCKLQDCPIRLSDTLNVAASGDCGVVMETRLEPAKMNSFNNT